MAQTSIFHQAGLRTLLKLPVRSEYQTEEQIQLLLPQTVESLMAMEQNTNSLQQVLQDKFYNRQAQQHQHGVRPHILPPPEPAENFYFLTEPIMFIPLPLFPHLQEQQQEKFWFQMEQTTYFQLRPFLIHLQLPEK